MKINLKRVQAGIFTASWEEILENLQLAAIGAAVALCFAGGGGWFAWVLLALGLVACFFRACSSTARIELEKARAELRYEMGRAAGRSAALADQARRDNVAAYWAQRR
jgi:fatty acid desaturase